MSFTSAEDGSIDEDAEPKYKLAIEEYSPAETSEDEMEYYYGAKDVTTGTSPNKLDDTQGSDLPERNGSKSPDL